MQGLILTLAILLFALSPTAAAFGSDLLRDRLFTLEPEQNRLSSKGFNSDDVSNRQFAPIKNSTSPDLHPGKALLLSAIIPGAGEFYAGSRVKAGLFFAAEVAAWTGAIVFYMDGKNKEDDFMAYADEHFFADVYRQWEFLKAQDANSGASNDKAFTGTKEEWETLSWEDKLEYLPTGGFTHDLPTEDQRNRSWSQNQQYYEMIGKYIHQFGFGWDDVFDHDAWANGQVVVGIDRGDSTETPYYDNVNNFAKNSVFYMGMRNDSNDAFKLSSWGFRIAILNHVASALDASFSVRAIKRNAHAELNFRQVRYAGEFVPAGGILINW